MRTVRTNMGAGKSIVIIYKQQRQLLIIIDNKDLRHILEKSSCWPPAASVSATGNIIISYFLFGGKSNVSRLYMAGAVRSMYMPNHFIQEIINERFNKPNKPKREP